MEPERLPCPFCGKPPDTLDRASTHTKTGRFYAIMCYCGSYAAKAYQCGETYEETLAKWNTRS